MLKTYIYTCEDCSHTFQDARPKQYASVPCKLGCSQCGSKNISYKLKPAEKAKSKGPFIGDSVRLGVTKQDAGFKEVLQKIKGKYPGSTIDV